MKLSIVTPCFNEEGSILNLYNKVKSVVNCDYEHIFIDNCSTDSTPRILRELASQNKNVKVIFNIRNFGATKSPYYGLLQASGDAVILIVADLQDPVELIPEFIKKWQQGYKIVIGIKVKSQENKLMFLIRTIFYNLISKISDVKLIKHFTGFGLYDKSFIDILRKIDDPNPYFRGLVAELGYDICEIPYTQPKRSKGKSKNNFYSLYDTAILGFVNHSKLPLRLASFIGFGISLLSILIALFYLIYKLLFWNAFELGLVPLIIGIFFIGGVQLFFLGIIGEYIGTILTQVKKHPLVIEKERINF